MMKLTHRERSGLWGLVFGYVVFVVLWLVVPGPYEEISRKLLLFAIGIAVAVGIFVALERRLPSVRSTDHRLSGWRFALYLAAAATWLLVLHAIVQSGPDSSRYFETRSAILTAAGLLMGGVTALVPGAPEPGSTRAAISTRASRAFRLADEGRSEDPEQSVTTHR